MIESTQFGSITINGQTYDHDVVVQKDGERVKKRKKKLSKSIYGTSHTLSLDELQWFYDADSQIIIFGTGQHGRLDLSREAREFLEQENMPFQLAPTPKAIEIYNQHPSPKTGLFHVTC